MGGWVGGVQYVPKIRKESPPVQNGTSLGHHDVIGVAGALQGDDTDGLRSRVGMIFTGGCQCIKDKGALATLKGSGWTAFESPGQPRTRDPSGVSCHDQSRMSSGAAAVSVATPMAHCRDRAYSRSNSFQVPFLYPLTNTFMTASIYMTVAVAVNRYADVAGSPGSMPCRVSSGLNQAIIVFAAAAAFNLPRWFEIAWSYEYQVSSSTSADLVLVCRESRHNF